jgi:hypothetical protein
MNKSYVKNICICFYIACDLLLRLCGQYFKKRLCILAYVYDTVYFLVSCGRIQNARVQRTPVESLCIPVWITPLQSCVYAQIIKYIINLKNSGPDKELPMLSVRRSCHVSESMQSLSLRLHSTAVA